MRRLAFLLLVAACTRPAAQPEDLPASRDDVAAALYRQLDLVIARYQELEDSQAPAAVLEREELVDRAREIAMKIVRVDPDADVRTLTARLERVR